MHKEDNLHSGTTVEEARRNALLTLGGVEPAKEVCRDCRGVPWLEALLQDARYGARMLRKSPFVVMAAALALAFGIGFATLQFSMVNCLLLRPLPFEDSHRLYVLERLDPKTQRRGSFWLTEWAGVRTALHSFETLAGFSLYDQSELTGAGLPALRYCSSRATANLSEVLRVHPLMGRWFGSGEDEKGSPRLVVLSYRAWQRDFAGAADIVGRAVRLGRKPATVIGVMPPAFHFPFNQDVWTNPDWEGETIEELIPIGRLRPEASLASARAELKVLSPLWAERLVEQQLVQLQALEQRLSKSNAKLLASLRENARAVGSYGLVRPRDFSRFFYSRQEVWTLWGMLVLGFCILLIACGNVATLLCARASTRARELAVRAALGASRRRLISQMLCESVWIAAIGTAGGLLLSVWGGRLISSYLEQQAGQPYWFRLVLDWRVMLFAVVALVFAGIASALMPALRSTRMDVQTTLKAGLGSGSSLRLGRFNRWVVVGEVALALPLLLLAAAQVKMVVVAYGSFPAGNPDYVLVGRVDLGPGMSPERDFDELRQRLASLPGVESVSWSERVPGYPQGRSIPVEVEGRSTASEVALPTALMEVIFPGYFHTLQMGLLEGRDFQQIDANQGPRVAIVNLPFARKHWPGESALGKRFRCPKDDQGWLASEDWLTVLGVAPDLRMQGMLAAKSDGAGFYVPLGQSARLNMTAFIRTRADPSALVGALRGAVATLGSETTVHSVGTLSSATAKSAEDRLVFVSLFLVFGLAALLLAAVGVAGLLSFTVTQRTKEFGIRLALGSTRARVLWLALREAVAQLVLGSVFGLALAWAGARFILTELFMSVSPYDPVVDAAVMAVMGAAGLLAVWLPVRRAARVDPMVALRYE